MLVWVDNAVWIRLLLCFGLAFASLVLTQVWPVESANEPDFDFSDRKPIPKPPEVQGWVLVRVCSVTGKLDHRFTEWAYIKPEFVIAIGNPPTSPDPCVALHGLTGRRIFVNGTMEGLARYVMDVLE